MTSTKYPIATNITHSKGMSEVQGFFEVEISDDCALIGNLTLLDLVPYMCI